MQQAKGPSLVAALDRRCRTELCGTRQCKPRRHGSRAVGWGRRL